MGNRLFILNVLFFSFFFFSVETSKGDGWARWSLGRLWQSCFLAFGGHANCWRQAHVISSRRLDSSWRCADILRWTSCSLRHDPNDKSLHTLQCRQHDDDITLISIAKDERTKKQVCRMDTDCYGAANLSEKKKKKKLARGTRKDGWIPC